MNNIHQVFSAHIQGQDLKLKTDGEKVGGSGLSGKLMRSCMQIVPQAKANSNPDDNRIVKIANSFILGSLGFTAAAICIVIPPIGLLATAAVSLKALQLHFKAAPPQTELERAIPEDSRHDYRAMIGKLDTHVDMLFDKAKMPEGQSVLIHVREDNGMGDLMLAAKTMNGLKKQFPDLDLQISIEVRTIKMEDAIAKIKNETNHESIYEYSKRPSDAKEPALILIMPAEVGEQVDKVWEQFKTPPNRLMIKEYGWGKPLASGGLGKASLGIFLDSKLTTLTDTKTNGQGISTLESTQASNLILNGKTPETYSDSNKLYFGYAHMPNPSAGFAKSIILKNSDDPKNIDFFMRTENLIPGANWNLAVAEDGLKFMDNYDGKPQEVDAISFNFLKENQISNVEIVKVKRVETSFKVTDPDGYEKTIKRFIPLKNEDGSFQLENPISLNVPDGPEGGKSLRIIDYFPISHSDMMTLVEHTEPEMLVTGNQSFGEAVSASKSFFYEELPNDKNLGQQMSGLAGSIQPEFQSTVESMKCFMGKMDYVKVAGALRDPNTRELFKAYGSKVQDEYDLSRRLELKVKREIISHLDPLVGSEMEKINKITERLCDEEEKSRGKAKTDASLNKKPAIRADTPIPIVGNNYQEAVDQLYDPIENIKNALSNII